MSHTIPGYLTSAELRSKARSKLGQTAQPDARDAHATEAMGVLYEMAAAPDTAADALALLHELQVHQVELDLLAEAQVAIRAELEADLTRQKQLYDCAPVGYFTLDAQGHLMELNLMGAQQLGVDREALLGQRLDALLSPADGATLRAMLGRIAQGDALHDAAHLTLAGGAHGSHRICASAQVDVQAGQILLTFTDWPTP